MPTEPSLTIAEDFYSIQGEGITTGTPSYFIRLKNCNLRCGLAAADLTSIRSAGEGQLVNANVRGELHKTGQATWTCDSAPVWLFGHKKPHSYLIDKWDNLRNRGEKLSDWIATGRVNLIWTGGEPTLPAHQKDIVSFLTAFDEHLLSTDRPLAVYNEVETNGTIVMDDDFFFRMQQINCSVKLANSGMAKDLRICPEALERISDHENHWYKFVVSSDADLDEIMTDFVGQYGIEARRVIIMPGLDRIEDLQERTHFVMEAAKSYGFIGLTRLHIAAWGAVTGV